MTTQRDSNRREIMCTNGRQENGELQCYDLIFVRKKPGMKMDFNFTSKHNKGTDHSI
jgi:ribonuclease P protein component